MIVVKYIRTRGWVGNINASCYKELVACLSAGGNLNISSNS
jgi:hypothetical protein